MVVRLAAWVVAVGLLLPQAAQAAPLGDAPRLQLRLAALEIPPAPAASSALSPGALFLGELGASLAAGLAAPALGALLGLAVDITLNGDKIGGFFTALGFIVGAASTPLFTSAIVDALTGAYSSDRISGRTFWIGTCTGFVLLAGAVVGGLIAANRLGNPGIGILVGGLVMVPLAQIIVMTVLAEPRPGPTVAPVRPAARREADVPERMLLVRRDAPRGSQAFTIGLPAVAF